MSKENLNDLIEKHTIKKEGDDMVESLIDKYQREQNIVNSFTSSEHKLIYLCFKMTMGVIKFGLTIWGVRMGLDLADLIRMAVMG